MTISAKAKISVIVPAYNVEAYIARCIESICKQTHSDLEIVIVNDCSTDGTAAILERLAQKETRLRLVHQPINCGLHAARVAGIKHATGSYIGFVDGDDWVNPGMFREMHDTALAADADVVICGAAIAQAPGKVLGHKVRFRCRKVLDGDVLAQFCQLRLGSGVIWNKLFRSEIIRPNLLRSMERKVDSGADYIVNFGCFADAARVVLVPECHYFYFYRADSMSRFSNDSANFALALRAYVVCLEVYVPFCASYARLIDQLYTMQLRMKSYRVNRLENLKSEHESLRESLLRLSAIHPAGIYALVHAFDPELFRDQVGLRTAVHRFASAGKALVNAALRAIYGADNENQSKPRT